jgi:Tfp pilus assembly protein PilF
MRALLAGVGAGVLAVALLFSWNNGSKAEEIVRHRNLGKAFYENPTTQALAVDEFRKALELAPESARERLNYGLALLHAGQTAEGLKELEQVQKQDPAIPHTWFNLGIAYKKDLQYAKAIVQFEGLLKLEPSDPIGHYNLGVLLKLTGKPDLAVPHFEASARLNPNLAGPHFQLYNMYRQTGRKEEADLEQQVFLEIKKRTAGAAVSEDLDWSFYSEVYETIDPADGGPAPPPKELKWRKTAMGMIADPASAQIAVLDVDGDGRPDLIVWSSKEVKVFRNGAVTPSECGLGALTGIVSIAPGDFNNDGFVDLAIVTRDGASLYENNNGMFRKSPVSVPSGRYSRALWLDYDHDYDLDLLLVGANSVLLRNNGAAGFSDETVRFPFRQWAATDAVAFDSVPDSSGVDVLVTYANAPAVLYRDKLAGRFVAEDLPSIAAGEAAVTAYDFNQDSWTDLAVATASGLQLLLNQKGTFGPPVMLEGKGRAIFADFENRGRTDIVLGSAIYRATGGGRFIRQAMPQANVAAVESVPVPSGMPGLVVVSSTGAIERWTNETPVMNRWLDVTLKGVKNLALAQGAKVEVKAAGIYQKQTYAGVQLHFGLGTHAVTDTVRITWPNGMVQNELKKPSGSLLALKEAPRLSGSCPMIFTWNGREFQFVTDVLGVAPLGASSGDGKFFPVDHDEYIQIPAQDLIANDNEYEVRITEELREVSYLDQVRLLAVDHPRELELFTNDKFKGPPFPEFRLFGGRRRIYPESAKDDRGRDVLSRLTRKDGKYPDSFLRRYDGTARLHGLDLDFGQAAKANRAVLVLNGWVDWADGSTFLAAAQERPGGLVMPYLQVKDARGQWQTVIQDMGIPSGKPKSIVVDLTGKFLAASREVRIVTDLCVYWDEIFLSEDLDQQVNVMTPARLKHADLHFRGFSRPLIDPERKQPEGFVYSDVQPVSQWNPTQGSYTRYGDVRELVDSLDDRMVIMGSGDEVTLHFDATRLPKVRDGWRREFLLFVDGWAKDADANTAYSQSVEPLPFHAMSAYPYPAAEHYPDDPLHQEYRKQFLTRPALKLLRPLTD